MKNTKVLRLVCLALLAVMLLSAFVGCDDTPKDTTAPTKGTTAPDTNDRDLLDDTVPQDLNFSSNPENEITFFNRDYQTYFKYEFACETLMNDTLYDAIHYRNIDVENRLGVKIKTMTIPGDWANRQAFIDTFSTSVNTNTDDIDVTGFCVSYGTQLAVQNLFYNMQRSNTANGDDAVGYLDLSKPWWNQSLVDACTIGGTLFFLGGDLTVSETAGTHNLWFCKDLFNEKFPDETFENLYTLVDEGKWTIDKMTDYVSQVYDDVNANQTIDDGDTMGFKFWAKDGGQLSGWIHSMDVEVLTRDSFGLYSLSENYATRAIPAVEKVAALYTSEGTLLVDNTHAQNTGLTNISNGNLLFKFGQFLDGNVYRGSGVNYGVLPLPKYDEEQENYANGMWTTSSVLVIGNNVSDARLNVITAVLEVMAAESYKQVTPAYYSTVVTGRYAKDEADARMFDLCLETCQYTFEMFYENLLKTNPGMLGIFSNVWDNPDTQYTIDSGKEIWGTKLEEVMLQFEMLAE